MEGLQQEINKLLDIITVLLIKLEEAGDDVISEIKLILDKSRTEIVLIQNSIRDSYIESEDGHINDDIIQ